MFKYVRNELQETFDMYVKNAIVHDHRTRQDDLFHSPTTRTNVGKMSIEYQGCLERSKIAKHIAWIALLLHSRKKTLKTTFLKNKKCNSMCLDLDIYIIVIKMCEIFHVLIFLGLNVLKIKKTS